MKHEYKQGWYRVRCIVGRKWELTYFDGTHHWCEDVRIQGGHASATAYCKERIDAAAPADPSDHDPPTCSADCKWRQRFSGYDLQRNALRVETASMVQPERCGWNLKPGRIGGHPLDYAPCTFTK